MLPDTQHYSRKYPELFLAQTQWIRENRRKENNQFDIPFEIGAGSRPPEPAHLSARR